MPREQINEEMTAPFRAYYCKDTPTDCCDFAVVNEETGLEVCRVWKEDDARTIADLLTELKDGQEGQSGFIPNQAGITKKMVRDAMGRAITAFPTEVLRVFNNGRAGDLEKAITSILVAALPGGQESALSEEKLDRIVEVNRRAWDNWEGPIDLSNVEQVRRHAAEEILRSLSG